MAKKLEIKLVKGLAGTPDWMRRITDALALRKIGNTRVVPDNPAMRGAAAKVKHLVTIKEVEA